MEQSITIYLRRPQFPEIVIDEERLYSAKNLKQLASVFIKSTLEANKTFVTILDKNCNEYWYEPKNLYIAPAMIQHKWSKRKIIDLYNSQCKNPEKFYQAKSISSKLVREIMADICNLISKSP